MLFSSNSLHFPLYKSYEAWTLDPRFFEFRIRDFMLNKLKFANGLALF